MKIYLIGSADDGNIELEQLYRKGYLTCIAAFTDGEYQDL